MTTNNSIDRTTQVQSVFSRSGQANNQAQALDANNPSVIMKAIAQQNTQVNQQQAAKITLMKKEQQEKPHIAVKDVNAFLEEADSDGDSFDRSVSDDDGAAEPLDLFPKDGLLL